MEMRSKIKIMPMSCSYCGGTGVVFGAYEGIDDYVEEACPICKGTGTVKLTEPIPSQDADKGEK